MSDDELIESKFIEFLETIQIINSGVYALRKQVYIGTETGMNYISLG